MTNEPKVYNRERTVSSTNDVRKVEHSQAKE